MQRRDFLKLGAVIPLIPSSVKSQICGYTNSYELVFNCNELSDVIKDDFFVDQKLLRKKIKEKTEKQIPYYIFGNLLNDITSNLALEISETMPLKECKFTIDLPENYLVNSMDLFIEVNKSKFNLKLFQNYKNKIITLLESDVAIGRDENTGGRFRTPDGNFYLQRMILDPWWYPPEWADTDKPSKPGKDNPYGLYMAEITTIDCPGNYEFFPNGDTGTRVHYSNKPIIKGKITHGCCRVKEMEELAKGILNNTQTLEGKTTGRGTIYPFLNTIPVKIYKN